ncbi:MAG TPA: hypothetical protein VMW71_08075 [Thermoplasmata archaeon]|nr:hypothetical protein [Thermoplasmata archaeon]
MDSSPSHFAYCGNSRQSKIRKSPRWEGDEAVASTVGTIMTILVFLTFLGVFTSQIVPAWMNDNESAHMSQCIEQMLSIKSNIDGLIVDYSNSLIAPTPIVIPVMLSATGIPVFAAPTSGILSFFPDEGSNRPTLNTSYTVDLTADDGHSGGTLRLYCPNRYYVEQYVIYESGAVILNQTDGEFIIAGMPMAVKEYNGVKTLQVTQVSLVGTNRTVGGTGAKVVNANLLYASTIPYDGSALTDVTLTILTKHGNAWANYFKKALNSSAADLTYGLNEDFYVPNPVKHDYPGTMNDYYEVTVTVYGVGTFYHTKASVQLSIGELGI